MSLQELAAASGVSVGMLSQVERNLTNPSARVITAIRRALDAPLQAIFETPEAADAPPKQADIAFVRRAHGRPSLDLGSIRKELLTAKDARGLQFMIIEIDPGGTSGGAPLSYPAEKGGLLLSGKLALRVNEEETVLHVGDSFLFDSMHPHSFHNPGAEPARVVWIIGAVSFERHL